GNFFAALLWNSLRVSFSARKIFLIFSEITPFDPQSDGSAAQIFFLGETPINDRLPRKSLTKPPQRTVWLNMPYSE
ncbi:MAG: hypothetical protein HLUCCO16_18965, partial [Phormidium sp. OSCR]